MTQTKKRERLTGCGMLLFSVTGFYFANRLPDSRVVDVGGTGLVPCIATLIMGLLSLLKCLSALLGAHDKVILAEKLNSSRSIVILTLVACYALVVEAIGFILASAGLLFFSLPLFGFRRLKIGIVYAFGISLVAWILFSKVFSSYLPSGYLFR